MRVQAVPGGECDERDIDYLDSAAESIEIGTFRGQGRELAAALRVMATELRAGRTVVVISGEAS